MNRNFCPTLISLEPRSLLSTLHPHPALDLPKMQIKPDFQHVGHQARHPHQVVAHNAHPNDEPMAATPHQAKHDGWTGTLVAGQISGCQSSLNGKSGAAEIFGSGDLDIGRKPISGVGFILATTGTFGTITICKGDSFLVCSVVSLDDGSAGNYNIICATGEFSGCEGTGIYKVYAQPDGRATLSINPHQ